MATSKAKRPIPLAQPQRYKTNPSTNPKTSSPKLNSQTNPRTNPDSAGLMPVKVHVYRAIAELNAGFEKVVQELQTLERVSFLRSGNVSALRELIRRVRAEANRDFTVAMHDREKANAAILSSSSTAAQPQVVRAGISA
jgi:hypothetical protein